MAKKPSILCVAHKQAGRCSDCRHANQDTCDFAEGHVFCRWLDEPRRKESECNAPIDLFPEPGGESRRYFFFERFTGDNGTYGIHADFRLLPEDAHLDLQ